MDVLVKSLPDHWRVIDVGAPDDLYADDGRDYSKPMFIRKDGLARIYFNEGETDDSGYLFVISWDQDSDGDCRGDLGLAIHVADEYATRYHKA